MSNKALYKVTFKKPNSSSKTSRKVKASSAAEAKSMVKYGNASDNNIIIISCEEVSSWAGIKAITKKKPPSGLFH